MKKRVCILLSIIMCFSLSTGISGTAVLAASEPASIQDTYEIDGVTYFNTGSDNFAVDKMKFFRDLLGTRSSNLLSEKGYFNEDWSQGEYGWVYFDQAESDLWLQLGVMLGTDLEPERLTYRDIDALYHAAVQGSYTYGQGSDNVYSGTRYDTASQNSLKAAEEWVFQKAYGSNKNFGYFKNDSSNQPVLVTAVTEKEHWKGSELCSRTVAAYFTNFRVFAIMPSDEGTNYTTEVIADTVNSQSTVASTVKNLTGSTVTGSQTLSNSKASSVESSVNGSESYSYAKGVKVGAEYGFTSAFKANAEVNYTATEAFATGWGTSDSVSSSKDSSYTVSIPMPPYTQAMITQTDTTAEYLTSYNCPIALRYDVTIVMYETSENKNGVMHVKYNYPDVDHDAVFTFADPLEGARGDLDDRIRSCENWNDMDDQCIRWKNILENGAPKQYDLGTAPEAVEALRCHIPMAPTGASYRQTLNVVANEVSGLMPTHPLCRIKIAQPGTGIYTDVVSYQLFDYYTVNMKVGEYSFANYLDLVGMNRYDLPYYGFSKDSGYWIVADKDGNQLDEANSPVRLENDPVSKNWRYTAVKPGTCFLVYRIDETAYCTADNPNQPTKNSDLKKTAALEIIVTEDDPTDTILISGNFQGHADAAPESLEGDNGLSVAVYDNTGKEIDRTYTWEAKELKGISVTEDGQVSFTQDGTYHVRAVSGNQRSDWYEVTAGHKAADVVQENVIPATCTKAGSCDLVSYCSVCGKELSRESAEEPATGHSFDSGTVTREPTREKDGIMTYTCTRCGRTMTATIPLTHTVTFDSNGADEVPSQKVRDGKQAKEPPMPDSPMEDFTFAGWYVVEDDEILDEFDFTTPITEDITLRAVFTYDLGGADYTRLEVLDGAPVVDEDIDTEVEETIITRKDLDAGYGLVLLSFPYAESDVPATDKDLLSSQAASLGVTPALWFDLSLYKMKDIWWGDPLEKLQDPDTIKLSSTSVPVRIVGEVPEELKKNDRTFYLLRCHDGKAEVVAQGSGIAYTGEIDKFSTYLLAYKDAFCPITPYTDTDSNQWYHDGVHWALEKGVMNGTGKSTFEPMTDTSRAMIVTMLWRMAGSPEADGTAGFRDVPDGMWYTKAIRWAAAKEIVNGYDKDSFGPADPVTREQMAAILYRFARTKDQGFNGKWCYRLRFDDADQVSDYAYEPLCWMTLNEIIRGMSDTELNPKGKAARAQVATMLMRFSEKVN